MQENKLTIRQLRNETEKDYEQKLVSANTWLVVFLVSIIVSCHAYVIFCCCQTCCDGKVDSEIEENREALEQGDDYEKKKSESDSSKKKKKKKKSGSGSDSTKKKKKKRNSDS